MKWFARSTRLVRKVRFRVLGLATIKDIPTESFNALRGQLLSEGWTQIYEYTGMDAWIDYGCLKLRKGRDKLKLEWDNWTEGSVEGRKDLIAAIAERIQLPATSEWRWSEYDQRQQRHPGDAAKPRA
jgi:hypothetical protein